MSENTKHEEHIDLTSGEIGYLWETYQHESLSIGGITHFLQHIDDQDIQYLLKERLAISEKRIEQVKIIFTKEDYPIPHGFDSGDVNLQAPRLFSDSIYLNYLLNTLQMELVNYNLAMLEAVKLYVQEFYKQVMHDTIDLEMKTKELAKKKGLYRRAPMVPTPDHIEFVQKDSFLAGWFENRRPLLAIEIAQLVFHEKRNSLGEAVMTAFSQVAKSKEVRQYFKRGKEIAGKHVEVFSGILHKDDVASASGLMTSEITESTESPFSDRLMMNFITKLSASSISGYGSAVSMSPRRDIATQYSRLIAEIAQYADDGAELLIKNKWMEQPPISANRKRLREKGRE